MNEFESDCEEKSRSCISNLDDEGGSSSQNPYKVTLSQRSVKEKGVDGIDTLQRMFAQEIGGKRRNIIGMEHVSPAISQQISCEEDRLRERDESEEHQPRENQIYIGSKVFSETEVLLERRHQCRPMNFNILLLGRAGQGKTLFIDRFLNSKYSVSSRVIQVIADPFVLKRASREFEGFRLELAFVDLPGYTAQTLEEYTQTAKTYIQTKLLQHAFKQQLVYSSNAKDQLDISDQRVHCCLFFMACEPQDNADWQIMSSIDKIVNIIPVINNQHQSRAEIKEIKMEISRRKEQSGVCWFTGEEFLSRKYPGKINVLNSSFGRIPPFVLQRNEQNSFQNSSEDFDLLRSLLISYFSDKLILITCGMQKKLEKRKELSENKYATLMARSMGGQPEKQYRRNCRKPPCQSSLLGRLMLAIPFVSLCFLCRLPK